MHAACIRVLLSLALGATLLLAGGGYAPGRRAVIRLIGTRAICLSLFTYYCFSSPHPLCEVPDLGVGGGRAASRRSAHSPARVVGREGPESVPLFSFCVFARSLQGDCGGSSKQAFGGPQPARLVKRFPYFISLILRGDRLD